MSWHGESEGMSRSHIPSDVSPTMEGNSAPNIIR